MALQFSEAVRNARLDSVEVTVGAAPTLEIRTGSPPANCAASDTGTVLATITLPSDWMAAAASGAKAKSGTWQDASGDSSGTPGHFRIKASTTCHVQGTAGISSGDLSFNQAVALGGDVTISTFTLTDANA